MNIKIQEVNRMLTELKGVYRQKRFETDNDYMKSYYGGCMSSLDELFINLTQYYIDHLEDLNKKE